MTENHLPAAIADFIEATNRGDSDAFVAAFTGDAYLRASSFTATTACAPGTAPITSASVRIFELVSAEPGTTPDSYVVTLTVTGDGFNGTGPMNFELRDGRIAGLRIS